MSTGERMDIEPTEVDIECQYVDIDYFQESYFGNFAGIASSGATSEEEVYFKKREGKWITS